MTDPIGRAHRTNYDDQLQPTVPQVRKVPPGLHFRGDDRDPKIATQGKP
jgi:hypothetical protein